VVPLLQNGNANTAQDLAAREKLAESGQERNSANPTTVLILRDGKIYFEGPADAVLISSDAYIKQFLASAE
jgi:hypothetical protein